MTKTEIPSDSAQPETFRQTWDTSFVGKEDRFSYFREGVCQAFLAFSPEEPAGGGVKARIETINVSKGSLSKIDVTPIRVFRTREDCAKIPDEYVSLGLQLNGGLAGKTVKKEYTQDVGDVSLVDVKSVVEFEVHPWDRYCAIVMVVPKSALDGLYDHDRVPSEKRLSSLPIKSCLKLLNTRNAVASHPEISHLFDATLCLLKAELLQDRDYLEECCITEVSVSSGMFTAVKDFVAHNVADPDLSTYSTANHFGISARYIQKLFSSEGTTFKTHVTTARLKQVQSDLINKYVDHVPVEDIAFRWGFRDLTTFHRNFKFHFGDTPRQMRLSSRKRETGLVSCAALRVQPSGPPR